MTVRHVTMTIEFDVDDEDVSDQCTGSDFDHVLENLRGNLQLDIESDWPGTGFKVTVDYDRDPELRPSRTPGHLINLVKINLTDQNDLGGRMPKCACGLWWGVDGVRGKVPFHSEALAQRVGDVHLYHVEHGIITETS